MYYSKGTQNVLTIPQNYSGNTFRVIDESDRTYKSESEQLQAESNFEPSDESPIKEEKGEPASPLSSLFSSISMEDLLLLGLIFVIHQHDPNDSTLILLLILLLAK